MDSERGARAALEQYRLRDCREVGRELGRGSYAAVVEVDYKGLRCAAKRIYRVLYEQGVGNLVSRFEEECQLLSQLRHPHIVQFLGVCFEPDSNLPVLVMEFLPTTLAQCLDTYGVLPAEISHGILQDVALGLRYLHDRPRPIVHRDLSANNVLLTSDMRGKISDLGVAKILRLSAAQRSRMTRGLGTLAYMPPEAAVQNPLYDTKVDVFSYGVLMVHTLSGCWPFPVEAVHVNPDNPADLTPLSEISRRQKYIDAIAGDHPLMHLIHQCLSNSPTHRPDAAHIAQQVSDVASHTPLSFSNRVEMMERIREDREQKKTLREENERLRLETEAAAHQQEVLIGQVEKLHQQVAVQGERIEAEVQDNGQLRNLVNTLTQEKERNSWEKEALSEQVEGFRRQVADQEQRIEAEVKDKDSLKDSLQELTREKEAVHREKMAKSLEVEDLRLQVVDLQADNVQLNESLKLKDEAYSQQINAKETELSTLRQELASSQDTASRRHEITSHIREQLKRCRTYLSSSQQPNLFTPGAKLVWRECAGLPFAMGGAQAVVINGIVYVGGGGYGSNAERCTVCSYHPGEDKWAALPPSPVMFFGVGQVAGQLVLVGGTIASTNVVTGAVYVFSESQQWEASIPPMPTARCALSVVSYSAVLVACGGKNDSDTTLPTVELFSGEASQWYQCPSLPSPRAWMSTVTIGETLFLLGGYKTSWSGSASESIVSASLSTLMDRAVHHSSGSASVQKLWTPLQRDAPYCFSAAAGIGGCLIVLGGTKKLGGTTGRVSAFIHAYLPTTSTWHPTGAIPVPLYQATAVVLPTNELLIIGGCNKERLTTKEVRKGTLEV